MTHWMRDGYGGTPNGLRRHRLQPPISPTGSAHLARIIPKGGHQLLYHRRESVRYTGGAEHVPPHPILVRLSSPFGQHVSRLASDGR